MSKEREIHLKALAKASNLSVTDAKAFKRALKSILDEDDDDDDTGSGKMSIAEALKASKK